MKIEDFSRLNDLYQKLVSCPLGMTTPWERRANNGKPLLYGGKRGLLAYGTIATWDEFDLIVALANALPEIMTAIECWSLIEHLRAPEGASLTIACDNPDFNGQPNSVVEIIDDWTGWMPRHFGAENVLEALRAAKTVRDIVMRETDAHGREKTK
jgi:hypothetical protein